MVKLICFRRGHSVPTPASPSLILSISPPPFSLLYMSSAGFLPPSLLRILQRSLLHSSFRLATLTSVLPYSPLLSCPRPFHGANLITRRIKADMFTPPCPFENQTNNERLRVFCLPTSSTYPLSTTSSSVPVPVMRQCKGMGDQYLLALFQRVLYPKSPKTSQTILFWDLQKGLFAVFFYEYAH